METTALGLQFFLIFVLTLVNAFFSSAEMAIISSNRNKIKLLAEAGDKAAQTLEQLMQDPTSFLSTIQVGITFAGFFSSASAATSVSGVLGSYLAEFNIPYGETIALVVVTLVLAYITLVFGELLPKRIALQKAEPLALFSARPIAFILKAMSPFVWLLTFSTNIFVRLFGFQTDNLDEQVSREEIKSLIEVGQSHGVINDVEKEMMHNIFDFDEVSAREIMTPRPNVYAIDIQEPFAAQLDEIIANQYSRIPVYDTDIDHMIGILYIKDLLSAAREVGFANIDVRSLLHEPFFVPEWKKIDELFKELQAQKKHLALLVDEYGSFSGLVTLEDLIEEVMGEIEDEYDEVEMPIRKIGDQTYLVDGLITLNELNEALELTLPSDEPEFDTLSGFLIYLLGYIPEPNSHAVIRYEQLTWTIQKMEEKRIALVELKIASQIAGE